jgi:selenoprotein W-related protein
MHVEIEYCVPCGHLDRATETQRELLSTYGRQLDGVFLRTGEGGVFKIRVNDELVLDAQQDGFDLDRLHKEIGQRLSA